MAALLPVTRAAAEVVPVVPTPLAAPTGTDDASGTTDAHAEHAHAHASDASDVPDLDGPHVCEGGSEAFPPLRPDLPWGCIHPSHPPAGLDPTVPVSLAELVDRDGASVAAVESAEAAGLPTSPAMAAGSTVACDGDGVSGHRVQAVYAYQVGAPNRFPELAASIQRWAAGVDDVVSRSAALTGGLRRPRWVTVSDGAGGCVADVLVVEMPQDAMGDPGTMFTQLRRDHGFTASDRKYLVWADTFRICGVGQFYPDDRPGQHQNYNNGNSGSAMFARVDAGCWGMQSPSAEAHELVHMFGGVSSNSPNGTAGAHCHDEHDVMCYPDGAGVAMRWTCPATQANLLDCNNDDYFTTVPAPGSWLASHWNVADNRWLIGGGDGVSTGAPGQFRVDTSGNDVTLPGIPTPVRADVVVPPDTPWSVSWTVPELCRVLGPADQLDAEVVCSARPGMRPAATATLTTPSGTATSSVRLVSPEGTRPLAVRLVPSPTGTPWWEGCAAESYPVTVEVTDEATGHPVYGVVPNVSSLGLSPPRAGTGTDIDGRYTHWQRWRPQAGTFSVRTVGIDVYPSVASPAVTVAPRDVCATLVTVDPLPASVERADDVTLTGRVTSGETGAGMAGRRVRITGTSAAGTTSDEIGVEADGRFTWTSPSLPASTSFSVEVVAAAPYGSAEAAAGTVAVTASPPPTTTPTTTSTTTTAAPPPTTTSTTVAPPPTAPTTTVAPPPTTTTTVPREPDPEPGSGAFSDVQPGAYFDVPVGWLLDRGITTGVEPSRFGPGRAVTRGQMALFLWRLAGTPGGGSAASFTDVPASSPYAAAVGWARSAGITAGTADGRYEPAATVSRAQMVTFLHRFAGKPAVASGASFGDVPAGSYYAVPARWASAHGITTGSGDGRFDPTGATTRGQMAAFLHRFAMAPDSRDADAQPVSGTN